ncbi:Z1 domain-containing protein [Jatrophihabitans fulvus]
MTSGYLSPASGTGNGDNAPVIGPAFTGFLQSVVLPEAREAVEKSAIDVLAAALSHGPGSTGLVVGRVQSGKTLSYEAVISLARDNGFALVVVISGISNPLLAQGERRLRRDLSLAEPDGWNFLSPSDNTQPEGYIRQEIVRIRDNWLRANTRNAWKQTAVVVVLKNYGRIFNLADDISTGLGDLRALVIDDEADQASLNTQVRRGRESSTHANLRQLRNAHPNHYYLQYTATPQAPLLIAIQDALSPDFVKVLEPGAGYTGGDTYFGSTGARIFGRDEALIESIPQSDLSAVTTPGARPPQSLRAAMQEFLMGAAHVVASGQRPETRSMLVHPSRETGAQHTFVQWITRLKSNWQDKYEHSDEAFPVDLQSEFRSAWSRLKATFDELANFEACWSELGLVFRNLDITEVNTRQGQTPVINWMSTKSYILVGGQAIDRGFTVEGLTVTYMPRSGGTFTADTIQQRARFFGYKSRYLGLCRVYLEQDVRVAFRRYLDHEGEMLRSLRTIANGEESLKDWKRRFLLDRQLSPTRASVIDIPTIRISTSDRWITDRFPVRGDSINLSAADSEIERLLRGVGWTPHQSGLHERAWITAVVAAELLQAVSPESLLVEPNFRALALQLAREADQAPANPSVAVFRMRPRHDLALRTEERDGGIQIFAGRTQGPRGYRGDRSVLEENAIINVQLHRVLVRSREEPPGATQDVRGKFLLTAWRVPDVSRSGWLIETGD